MSQSAEYFEAPAHDGLYRRIQKHLSGGQVQIPLEIRLWGGQTYRFGEDEPTVKISVKDHKGLEALRRFGGLASPDSCMRRHNR
jgi:cyclopropane-fatty-acyl-phospholipid synthase